MPGMLYLSPLRGRAKLYRAIDMTVKANLERIVGLEDDVKDLDVRVARLETSMIDLLARIDIIIRMSRATVVIVAATLGIDLGIEGGMI